MGPRVTAVLPWRSPILVWWRNLSEMATNAAQCEQNGHQKVCSLTSFHGEQPFLHGNEGLCCQRVCLLELFVSRPNHPSPQEHSLHQTASIVFSLFFWNRLLDFVRHTSPPRRVVEEVDGSAGVRNGKGIVLFLWNDIWVRGAAPSPAEVFRRHRCEALTTSLTLSHHQTAKLDSRAPRQKC